MQTVVVILMILVCFNFILKQTFRKRLSVIGMSVVCALFTGMMWTYAIEQSKTQIADWLSDTSLMLDSSVLLSIEICLQISFCMLAVHIQTGEKIKPRILWTYRILRWFPGLLIFPVLFSLLTYAIFSFPGTSFSVIAWCLAAAVLILIPAATGFMHDLIPEKDLRLELLFLTNALAAVLGIVATVNGRTAVNGVSEIEWSSFLGVLILTVGGSLGGFALRKYRIRKQ